MIKIKEIQTPFFKGFYGSNLYDAGDFANGELDYVNSERESKGLKPLENDNDFEYDYKEFYKNIYTQFHTLIYKAINDYLGTNIKSLNPSLYSPKFYNYSNDKIFTDIEFSQSDFNKLTNFAFQNESFGDWLNDNLKSRDGFLSFYPHEIAEFRELFYKEWKTDSNLMQCILEFVMLEISYDNKSLEIDIYEGISDKYLPLINFDELCI